MEEDKDKWIEDVLGSMKGSQRAKPDPSLFAKIENRLDTPEANIIPMRQWNYAAAAAVLVLVLNAFALRQVVQTKDYNAGEMVVSTDDSSQSLISNYKIYE